MIYTAKTMIWSQMIFGQSRFVVSATYMLASNLNKKTIEKTMKTRRKILFSVCLSVLFCLFLFPNVSVKANDIGSFDNPYLSGFLRVTPDGWQIEIVDFDDDAWPEVFAKNKFNKPPLDGNKMVMIKIRIVNHSTSKQPNRISTRDFYLVGSNKVLYSSSDRKSRCGVIPDKLGASLYIGGETIGNVCFQVDEFEYRASFLLVYRLRYNEYIYIKVW